MSPALVALRNHLTIALIAAVSTAGAPLSTGLAQEELAITGGTVIDGTGAPPIPDAVVIVSGERISAVGPAEGTPVPSGARVIDAAGKTVLPGLIDAHMHIGGSGGGSADPREFTPEAAAANFRSYLLFGVTTVFDIAGNPFLEEQQEALSSGAIPGPRLFGVKYGITTPGAHPMGLLEEYKLTELLGPVYPQVTTVEEARAAVRKVAADKTGGVKIFHSRSEFPGASHYDADKDKMKPEVLRALVEEAHANGLKVYAHIAFPSEAREAVAAGVDGLTHSISMAETDTPEIFAMMAERGVYYMPTLAQIEANYALQVDPFLPEKLRGKVWGVILDSLTAPNSVVRARLAKPGYTADARRNLEIAKANLDRAAKAGVKIVMGTDAGNAGTMHGATVPRELELMVEAGLTPMQALVAATGTAAAAISHDNELGTLEPGKLADVIIVGGDPLRDIGEIRNVETAIKGGKVMALKELAFK